jgi:hypothetical protein
MANDYIALASFRLTSPTTTVNFASINQGYRHLVCVVEGLGTVNTYAFFRVNASTTGYQYVFANAENTSLDSQGPTDDKFQIPLRSSNWDAGYRTHAIIDFMDYSQTNKHKTFLMRSGSASASAEMSFGRWGSNDAITSIRFTINAGNFATGTTFSLYGIKH